MQGKPAETAKRCMRMGNVSNVCSTTPPSFALRKRMSSKASRPSNRDSTRTALLVQIYASFLRSLRARRLEKAIMAAITA